MTARDDLLEQLRFIATPESAHLINSVFAEFPNAPEFSRKQRTNEAALNERIAKCAAELDSLLESGNQDWQEVYFGVTPDFRRILNQLPERFTDAKAFTHEAVKEIPKGGTGGTVQNIFLRSIGVWCRHTYETLAGKRAARGGKLDGLFEYACDYACIPYPSRDSDGGDYWPIRLALEAFDAA